MVEAPLEFITSWNQWVQILGLVWLGLSVLTLLRYAVKLTTTKDPKSKYDLINLKEINALKTASVFFIMSIAFFANGFLGEIGMSWLAIRLIVTLFLSFIIGFIVQNMLKFYYPFYVEKRLKKLRYQPRISPKTGKAMKLLSEEEEDVYLDEGMQAEENVFSVDYDVWVDEETGYTKIEKYAGHLHAIQCPDCNYQTFKVDHEEILTHPTETEDGELTKHMECSYCGFKESKNFKISKVKPIESSSETAPAV